MVMSLSARDRRVAFGPNSYINRYNYGTTEQIIAVTDMLSEGPIQGLVEGGSSVFVNNDRLFADNDTGYNSKVEERVVFDPPASPASALKTVSIQDYAGTFIYDLSTPGNRFLTLFKLIEFNTGSLTITNAELITNGTDRDVKLTFSGTLPQVNGNNYWGSLASTLVNAQHGNITDGCGIGYIAGANDRQHAGFITEITQDSGATTGTIRIRTNRYPGKNPRNPMKWVTNQTADGLAKLTVHVSQFLKINSFDAQTKTFTLNSVPAAEFPNGLDFGVTAALSSASNPASQNATKYPGSSFQFRDGRVDQDPIQTLRGVGNTTIALTAPGEMTRGTPKVITASGAQASEIDAVNLIFNYPGGLYTQNTENGDTEAAGAGYKITLTTFANDDTNGLDRDLEGNFLVTSSHTGVLHNSVSAGDSIFAHGTKSKTAWSYSHYIDLEPFQPYNKFTLTITRVTNSDNITEESGGRAHTWGQRNSEGTSTKLLFRGNDIDKWQAVQSSNLTQVLGIIKEKLNYPYTAVANVTFSARSFQDTPTRTYDCRGLLVKIPSNYVTREQAGLNADGTFKNVDDLYTGIWNGEFATAKAYTDNPAWIFYDILSNNRYGIGEFIDESLEIDKFSLYRIARYCDELVPDGSGGFEPRFRGNYYFQKATDVYKVLKDLASTFRGMLYWMDGKITPVFDEKRAPIYAFNATNVNEGAFEYESTGSKTRANQIVVSWNNPQSDYKLEPLIVEDRQNILETGSLIKDTCTAFGCTSESQAIRYGRWKLWTAINQTEIVSFKTSINAAFLAPGDVITIQDNQDFGLAYSGRITNVATAGGSQTLTLDRAITDKNGSALTGTDSVTLKEISVIIVDKKVILAADATVGAVDLERGTSITTAKDDAGAPLDLTPTLANIESRILNAYDDAGKLLPLQLELESKIETFSISAYDHANKTVTVPTTIIPANDAGGKGTIWGIKDNTVAAPKEYKIMSITMESDTVYGITAVEYYQNKFDAVDNNFTLAINDPLDPPETDISALTPTGLRILRTPDPNGNGEELIFQWNPVSNDSLVSHYEVTHDVPTLDSPLNTYQSSVPFNRVPNGHFIFSVRSVTKGGKKSAPALIDTYVEDIFGGNFERIYGLMKGGKVSHPTAIVVNDTTTPETRQFKFEKNPVFLMSNRDIDSTSVTLNTGELNFASLHDHTSESWFGNGGVTNVLDQPGGSIVGQTFGNEAPFAKSDGYVARIGNNLHVLNHIFDTKLNVDYWYDQLARNKYLYNQNRSGSDPDIYTGSPGPNTWITPAGTVTVNENSNVVTGNNSTTFTSTFKVTDIIKFGPSQAAKVAYIENDQELYIDRVFEYKTATTNGASASGDASTIQYTSVGHPFVVGDSITIKSNTMDNNFRKTTKTEVIAVDATTFTVATEDNSVTASENASNGIATASTAITADAYERNGISVDFTSDHLVGFLNGLNGDFENFCRLDPDISKTRALVIDVNPAFIAFDGGSTPAQQTDNNGDPLYSDITLTARAVNFTAPEFKVTGSGFNQVSADAMNAFSLDADGTFSITLDDGQQVLSNGYDNGSTLDFTVDVRETADPLNTAKSISQVARIFKIKDGALGFDGRTLKVLSDDYTVLFDKAGKNPVYNGSGDSDIDLRIELGNFTDAIYKITMRRPSGLGQSTESTVFQDWADATTNTVTFTYAEGTGNTQWNPIYDNGQWPTVFFVEAGEKQAGWSPGTAPADGVKASDSISIGGFVAGSDGASVSVPNRTHNYSTDRFGDVGTGTSQVLSGSGTTIEVILEGDVANYVGKTGAAATIGGPLDASAPLSHGDWYFESITHVGGGDLTIGAVSANLSTDIVTIADHTIFNSIDKHAEGTNPSSVNPTDDREIIEFVIKIRQGLSTLTRTAQQSLTKSVAGRDAAAIVELFHLSANSSAPTDLPSCKYEFSTGTISAISDSTLTWTESRPATTSQNKYLWRVRKRVFPGDTDTISIADNSWEDGTAKLDSFFGDIGIDARSIILTPSSHVIKYDDTGAETTSITFATTTFNTSSNLFYKFSVGGVAKQNSLTNNTLTDPDQFTLADADEPAVGSFVTVKVELYEGVDANAAANNEVAQDTVTIFAVQDGDNAVTGFLTNAAHVVPTDEQGNIDSSLVSSGNISQAGGTFKIFVGSEDKTTQNSIQYSVAANSEVGVDVSINSDGQYTVSSTGLQDSGTATFNAVLPASIVAGTQAVTIPAVYSISKSKKGDLGQTGANAASAILTPASQQVIYSFDSVGQDYDPSQTSVGLTVSPNGIQNAQYSWGGDSVTQNAQANSTATNTVSFASVQQATQISQASKTATVVVTGQNSRGEAISPIQLSVTVNAIENSVGSDGAAGLHGLRNASGYIYFTQPSANKPSGQQLPTATDYSFTQQAFVGLATTGGQQLWSIEAPTFTPGASNNYWYVTWQAQEARESNGTPSGDTTVGSSGQQASQGSLVFSSQQDAQDVYQGAGFTGLVTFTSLQSGGSTQIDGSRITTGTIQAERISLSASVHNISDLNNDEGYTDAQQTLQTHYTKTQIDAFGFQTSAITASGQVNLAQANNLQSGFQTQAFTQSSQVNAQQINDPSSLLLTNSQKQQIANAISDVSGLNTLLQNQQSVSVNFSQSALTAGKLVLQTQGLIVTKQTYSIGSQSTIVLDTTGGNNAMTIYNQGTARVILGKIS